MIPIDQARWGAMLLALQKHAIALAFKSLACFCKAKSMAPGTGVPKNPPIIQMLNPF
jgi:hypothetical protein